MKGKRRLKKAGIIVLIALILLFAVSVIYVKQYYHVQDRQAALESTDDVKVEEVDYGCFFDGPGNDTALIFYPGAKVEDLAYASLLKQLAAGRNRLLSGTHAGKSGVYGNESCG